MAARSRFRRLFQEMSARLLGQHVTVYPAYGRADPDQPGSWIVPLRVWVHDNRDTPFAKRAFERWARRHFEKDLQRTLDDKELSQLERTLEPFISDDKTNESLEFVFADDPDERVFAFSQRSSLNGVIEEGVRIPGDFIQEIYARRNDANRWLKIRARTGDGRGNGEGVVRFLNPEGLSVISDIDDTIKVTHVPAGKKTVLKNTFLKEFQVAEGMKDRYHYITRDAGDAADVCFHYISGSPWQLFSLLHEFLIEQGHFPRGTFHMKNFRKNLFEAGALESIRALALGGDLATLDQKIRQITTLMIHFPLRRFILIGDSGEKDPEVYRAVERLFPTQVERIIIRDVLGGRLAGMERITGEDLSVFLDTSELEAEMAEMVAQATLERPEPA